MRVAVVGLGVAGSYLVRRLNDMGYDVVGFERQRRETFKAICAWGTSYNAIKYFLSRVHFNFDEYLLHLGKHLYLDNGIESSTVPLKGLCTYDKARLQLDLTDGLNVRYGFTPRISDLLNEYDLVVDATGVSRSILPKPVRDEVVPCFEYRIKYRNGKPFDDFYVKIFKKCTGYFWYFPLGDDEAFVGAGDLMNNHVNEVKQFIERHGGEVVGKYGRAVRIVPPALCQPIFSGKVVGVGESVGTVYPMLGEGILPSLECAELFVENMMDLEKYVVNVLKTFEPFLNVYKLIKLKHADSLSLVKHLPMLLKAFNYMKEREDRFGLVVRRNDLYLIFKT